MEQESLAKALRDAVEQAGNNQSAFARAIGMSQQRVSYLLDNGKALPAEFVLRAEDAGFGSRHHLRPDLYARPCPVCSGGEAAAT
ncbi:transcriptional regulator [Sphingomonas sp. SRS2]|uniref:transcriptional regulator n=1 Tax=Sphingomonas sp. SRS2 TaxID=133190 RepID=UPI0006184615|nr:YdaS family helix-turn-helix protein [Sphingomonas sp. SRS2]KKC24907.1 hypothetical protein WP12_16930 [Sphingomonas sp. SRS2]